MSITELEDRIAKIERKLASLSAAVEGGPPADINGWIDQIHGTFKYDATYRQGAQLGGKWRKSTRGGKRSDVRKAAAK